VQSVPRGRVLSQVSVLTVLFIPGACSEGGELCIRGRDAVRGRFVCSGVYSHLPVTSYPIGALTLKQISGEFPLENLRLPLQKQAEHAYITTIS
jgi:hypothetical protein